MTHLAHPTSTAQARRASPAAGALRRWVARHVVAVDPAPALGLLDTLDARRRAGESGTTVWTRTTSAP